jgi:hypothetical protein
MPFSEDGDGLYYKLIVANIENVTMAHIHVAPQGQLNGVVCFINPIDLLLRMVI